MQTRYTSAVDVHMSLAVVQQAGWTITTVVSESFTTACLPMQMAWCS